jgi:hypothetical protein
MILIAIKTYFLREKRATLPALSKALGLNKTLLEEMLNLWIKKGKLRRISFETACPSDMCSSCQLGCFKKQKGPTLPDIYEWIPIPSNEPLVN